MYWMWGLREAQYLHGSVGCQISVDMFYAPVFRLISSYIFCLYFLFVKFEFDSIGTFFFFSYSWLCHKNNCKLLWYNSYLLPFWKMTPTITIVNKQILFHDCKYLFLDKVILIKLCLQLFKIIYFEWRLNDTKFFQLINCSCCLIKYSFC